MKKLFTVFLTAVLCVLAVAGVACDGCGNEKGDNGKDNASVNYTFYAPDGAPALSLAKFISEGQNFDEKSKFEYRVVSATDIGGVMQKGTGDFVIIPVNAASKLYKANASDPYIMLSVVTHGNLYIMSKGENTLDALVGKVVGVIGMGNVPDLTFKAVLKAANVDYEVSDTPVEGKVALKYFNTASDMIPLLKKGALGIGLLPEPAATKLTKIAPEYSLALDLQKLYDAEKSGYPQAVLMVKKSVFANRALVEKIADAFADNVDWVKQNAKKAVEAVNGALAEGVTPSLSADAITPEVIENCKIFWQSAASAKAEVKSYLSAIKAIENKSANDVTDEFFAD